jgi:hypothetical protein
MVMGGKILNEKNWKCLIYKRKGKKGGREL